jgi:hypothetical protein
MFSNIDRNQLERTITYVCFSPLFYGLLAVLLAAHPLAVSANLVYITNIGMGSGIGMMIFARLLRRVLLPSYKPAGRRRVALTAVILSSIGELIAAAGALIVWLGAPLPNCVPFLIISALYFADFRLIRFPEIMAKWTEDDT